MLKNTELYPTVELLQPVENTHSAARLEFIQLEGWKHIATVAEDYEDYTLVSRKLLSF